MSKLELVPVFYHDQPEWEVAHASKPRHEVRQMKREGLGRFIQHGRAFRLHAKSPQTLVAPVVILREGVSVRDGTTPCTITVSETLANVGIVGNVRNPEAVVRTAQYKIAAWPYLSDTRAVLVRGLRKP